MAAPKLTNEQRDLLLIWLAADYDSRLIIKWFSDRGWPELTHNNLYYYREKHQVDIEAIRTERRSAALTTGLALKEERIARLAQHADELEAIKWAPDKNGRLWNEKAWRETLDDIAKEVGHRRQGVDLAMEQEIEAVLEHLRTQLDPETFARIVVALAKEGERSGGE